MAPLFQTLHVDRDHAARLVEDAWGIELGELLKAAQNHTYAAVDPATNSKYAVRITPDHACTEHGRIADEVDFVTYLAKSGVQGVCSFVASKRDNGAFAVRDGDCTVCVSEWAAGQPVDVFAYAWLSDDAFARAWGAWFARLHAVSRAYALQFPDVVKRMRRWDKVLDGILSGTPVHPDDAAAMTDPLKYGILHGDLNISNFHVHYPSASDAAPLLSVFDWDQVQVGWFEADLAQACVLLLMLSEAGSVIVGEKVPQADPDAFLAWMVDGYESVAGVGAIDRARLGRVLQVRKSLYSKFCRRAQEEGVPEGMRAFIDYVVKWVTEYPPMLS